jgi:hypothetical protein
VPPAHAANPAVVVLHRKFAERYFANIRFLSMVPLMLCEGAESCGPWGPRASQLYARCCVWFIFADVPMLALASIYFKNIRNDASLEGHRYWIMYCSILTSTYMLAHKLPQIGPFLSRLKERTQLEHERTLLFASLGLDPGGALSAHPLQLASHSMMSAAHHAAITAGAPAAVHDEPEFVGLGGPHVGPIGSAPILAHQQPLHTPGIAGHSQHSPPAPHHPSPAAAEANGARHSLPVQPAATVRGVCDGCGRSVMSDDNSRVKEGSKYYHLACVKGSCGRCGRIVHRDAERESRDGAYWHGECVRAAAALCR